tara:strand:+ start:1013 stop:1147 length:135 start_codon:yes stop_codon:yes gene_type:complete
MKYSLYVIELDKQVGRIKNSERKTLILFLEIVVFMLASQQEHLC